MPLRRNYQYVLTSSSISCLSNQKVHSHDYWETRWSQSEVKELISMTSLVAYDVGCFQIPWSKQDQGCWTTVPKCYHQHWNLATQRRTRVWYLALVNQGCERPQIDCHSTNGLSSSIAATSPMLVRVSSFLLQAQQIARPLLVPCRVSSFLLQTQQIARPFLVPGFVFSFLLPDATDRQAFVDAGFFFFDFPVYFFVHAAQWFLIKRRHSSLWNSGVSLGLDLVICIRKHSENYCL